MPDLVAPEGFEIEGWTYAGRRETTGGGLAYMYVDGNGEELLYKDKHRVIGGLYELPVRRADGRTSVMFTNMVYRGINADAPAGQWEAEDRAAYTAVEARKSEARDKRDDTAFGSLTLDDLRAITRRVPPGQRYALVARVLAYLAAVSG